MKLPPVLCHAADGDCYTADQMFDYAERRIEALTKERDAWRQAHGEQVGLLLKTASERDALQSTVNAACVSAIRQERQIAEYDSLITWLNSNTTFYDVDVRASTQHPNIPVLASVSNRIWYHATDNQLDFPFSQVIRSAIEAAQAEQSRYRTHLKARYAT